MMSSTLWDPGWKDIFSGVADLREEALVVSAVNLAVSAAELADALIADIWFAWYEDAALIEFLMVPVTVTRSIPVNSCVTSFEWSRPGPQRQQDQ